MEPEALRHLAAMSDDERRLILPLHAQPGRGPWRVYIRWLRQREDERARVLELALELADGSGSEAKRAELRERLGVVELGWWRLVQPAPRVFNCSDASVKPLTPRLRFVFECPSQWETMAPTRRVGVRQCDGCQAYVFDCASVEEAETHARLGRCIRVAPDVSAPRFSELTRMMIGRPDRAALWAAALLEG